MGQCEFDANMDGICDCNPWQCGDPLEYQGHFYATVSIGGQCWFAENLRNLNYANGDAIPNALGISNWSSTTEGWTVVFGETEPCYSNAPDFDACQSDLALQEYGRLYNWYAGVDSRGLCPNGWHVPTELEWTALTDHLGGMAVAGDALKAETGFSSNGGGSNSSGFSGLPGGFRNHVGTFGAAGDAGMWWTCLW